MSAGQVAIPERVLPVGAAPRRGARAGELAAIQTIAYRDLLKFLRDPARIISTLVFPVVFIGAMGYTMQANLPPNIGFRYIDFIFTGVYAQTLFQTTMFGVISLLEDRESDFAQEVFVAPISRYSIVVGKIVGETLVAVPHAIAVVLCGLALGVTIAPWQVLVLVACGLACCLLGGAFGLLVLSNISSQRAAQQIFPFIVLPQFFLAGLFSPVKVLPLPLDVLSRISPLRYGVDLVRSLYYLGTPEYDTVVLANPLFNVVAVSAIFVVFVAIGTFLFVRRERNR